MVNKQGYLTRKDVAYEWTDQCQSTYIELKELLTTSPILTFPDFTEEFLLAIDASGAGLGTVLS